MREPATVAAVVLAAGGSSRFGPGAKLLAPWRGRPLLLAALDAAIGAGLDETVVVGGAVDLSGVVPGSVTLLRNEAWSSGQASSLRAGLDWCARRGHAAAVVGLGDAPLVPASAWRAVAGSAADLAVATFGGRRHPPVRIGRARFGEVPASGDEGARRLLAGAPGVVEVPCEGAPLDVDTVEDLRALGGERGAIGSPGASGGGGGSAGRGAPRGAS
ncbi:MAG: nucleotidyltransferase family protein [Acidimicrobiales bacterium]